MTYDFDKVIPRRGTNCVKWDECPDADTIPMWVADMDFETAPCVTRAIQQRAEHGVFGYNLVPESFYDSIISWNRRRHQWSISREWLMYTIGVVPAVSAVIKGLTKPGDAVAFFTPAYNCFFSSVRNNGCRLVEEPLTWDAASTTYSIDFAHLEETLRREQIRLFVLCNPHNPTGRVWRQDELTRLAQLCRRYGVIVLSDEIHCEFVHPRLGRRYLPFAPIAESEGCAWVVTNAPNKAFNIAGLQTAYIVAADADFRTRIDRAINDNEVCDLNCFSFVALEAAYSADGEAWLDELVAYIYANYELFCQMVHAELPQLPIAPLEGTYLAWMDVSRLTSDADALAARIKEKEKVWVNGSGMYGGKGFLRVNLAAPRSLVEEGTSRLIRGLQSAGEMK